MEILQINELTIVMIAILIYFIVMTLFFRFYTKAYKRKQSKCKHEKFIFHDKNLMEHEPFCSHCKKSLMEINF